MSGITQSEWADLLAAEKTAERIEHIRRIKSAIHGVQPDLTGDEVTELAKAIYEAVAAL
jgi:hypothetical protein